MTIDAYKNLAEPITIDAYKNLAGFFRTRLITKWDTLAQIKFEQENMILSYYPIFFFKVKIKTWTPENTPCDCLCNWQ